MLSSFLEVAVIIRWPFLTVIISWSCCICQEYPLIESIYSRMMMSQTVMEKKLMGHYLMTGVSMTTSLLWWSDGEEVDYYLIISWSCDLLALATSLLLPNVACTFFYLHLWNLNWVPLFCRVACGAVAVWVSGWWRVVDRDNITMLHACDVWVNGQWVMEIACCLLESWRLEWCSRNDICLSNHLFSIFCMWMMYGCNYCVELNVLSGYMYCYRFELPLPDRNRYVLDRYIPFPISHNTAFVFPSAYPVSVPVPDKKNRNRNG